LCYEGEGTVTETIQTTDLRRRVREVLDRVRIKGESVVVCTYDTPQAVLIPYDEFETYRRWRERQEQREAWLAELRTIAERVSARAALSEEVADTLIDEARRGAQAP
jgi:prevent-host-death family protein